MNPALPKKNKLNGDRNGGDKLERKSGVKKAQSVIEYALLIAVVAAAFMAMQLYVQRAVQANFKLIQDQINAEPE